MDARTAVSPIGPCSATVSWRSLVEADTHSTTWCQRAVRATPASATTRSPPGCVVGDSTRERSCCATFRSVPRSKCSLSSMRQSSHRQLLSNSSRRRPSKDTVSTPLNRHQSARAWAMNSGPSSTRRNAGAASWSNRATTASAPEESSTMAGHSRVNSSITLSSSRFAWARAAASASACVSCNDAARRVPSFCRAQRPSDRGSTTICGLAVAIVLFLRARSGLSEARLIAAGEAGSSGVQPTTG